MNIYSKSPYIETINCYGQSIEKYIYGHYNSTHDVWAFKDETGSTEINMCFDNTTNNKLTAMWKIYNGEGENISQLEYDRARNYYE